MDEIIKVILAGGTGAGLVVAWIVLFGKGFIDHQMNKNLEEYKGKIANDNAKSIEVLKSKLNEELLKEIEKFKADIQIETTLNEKRKIEGFQREIDALNNIRNLLKTAVSKIEILKLPFNPPGCGNVASDAVIKFLNCFENNRAFLSKETTRILDNAHAALSSWAFGDLSITHGKDPSDMKWWNTPYEKIDEAIDHLENTIRKKMGD
jgi:hypothetical protein